MDEKSTGKLPPLPPSDEKSFQQNKFDNYYRYTSRDFWKDAQIISENPKAFEKCEHYFTPTDDGAKCNKCHFGLIGIFEISNGKLAHKGKTLEI